MNSAEVMVVIRDSTGEMRQFRQHAFIHADLPFALFPLSVLGAQGCYFDFYDVLGLQCGSMILPFSLTNGLYLAELFSLSLDCSQFSTFSHFNADQTVLVAQTRSKNVSLPDLDVLPIPIPLPPSVESVPSLTDASNIVSSTFNLPASSVSFSSKLTGTGLLLLIEHRRLGHLHDRVLKRMIDCGMCGNIVWVPGIVLRAHCWDCLKGQQKRNISAPDPNICELHPLSCQVLVWDWCGPQYVRALHGESYWFLAVCPCGYHWALSLPEI